MTTLIQPRRVTREQFLEFANENRKSDLSLISELEWRELQKSDYLLDRFLSYPIDLRRTLHLMLTNNIPARMIESFYKLLEYAQEIESDSIDFMKIFHDDLIDIIKKRNPEVSTSFYTELLMANNDSLLASFPWLLRHIYTEERTLEALKVWNEMDGPINTMYVILELFERWEEFKHYPIVWSMNVLFSEEESTLDQTGF